MTTPQMDWLDDQRRKRAVSSDDIVRRMKLMDVPPGSYDEETLYDAVAEIERLRAAANRTLNAFFCCEGLDNTDLMDAFSEWAVLMDHAAMPEARAWIAKWEARRG